MPTGRTRATVLVTALTLSAALTAAVAIVNARPTPAATHTVALGAYPLAVVLEPRTGRAFVANEGDGSVSVLDLSSPHPQVLRTVRLGAANVVAPLTLASDAGTHHLFVAGGTTAGDASAVRLLDSRDGAVRATVRVGPEASALAVDERAGHVLVATQGDNRVSLLDARTGAVLRTTWVGLAPLALAVDARTARAFVLGANGTPLSYGGTSGWIRILDTRTGALVRTVAVGHEPGGIAADARTARVFVANSGDDTVSVLDARTGALLRTVRVGWAPAALAVDARAGCVFVMDEGDGTLSVLDARSGALRRTVAVFPATSISAVTQPYALAVDEARARVYVTAWGQLDPAGLPTGTGQLAVLDARSGALLRTLALGVAPRAVAVQESSGRVVVVDSGGTLRATPGWAERWTRQVAAWIPWLGRVVPRSPATYRVPGSVHVIAPGGQ